MRSLFSCAAVGAIAGAALVALVGSSQARPPGKALEIYFVDVEGGQATLFVTPEGQSLLIDTDVYKRQELLQSTCSPSAIKLCSGGGSRSPGRAQHTYNAVSYTHLDVYKRQS